MSPGLAHDDQAQLPAAALSLVVVAMVLVPEAVLWADPPGSLNPNLNVAFHLFDVPLLTLIVMAGRLAWTNRTTRSHFTAAGAAFLALAGWSLVAAAANPSWRAVDWWFHVAGAVAAAYTIYISGQAARATILKAVAGLASLQGLLGVAQVLHGEKLQIIGLEYQERLHAAGGQPAANGSFHHPYHLAAFLMVGAAAALTLRALGRPQDRKVAGIALLLIGVSLPATYSRSALAVAVVLMAVAIVAPSQRRLRGAACLMAIGLVLGIAPIAQQWEAKVEKSIPTRVETPTSGAQTPGRSTLDRVTSGRVGLAREALDVMREHPAFGIGPGRYVLHINAKSGASSIPPHNAVVHAGAEMGLVGFALSAVALTGLAWWAVRGGGLSTTMFLTLLPFHLLDTYAHAFPRGIVMSGIWLGLVGITRRHAKRDDTCLELRDAPRAVSSSRRPPVGGP